MSGEMVYLSSASRRILVVGSSNTDMVVKTKTLPRPGETVLGGTFLMNAGGKGANQAVAAARLGGDVSFICKTGQDIFGSQAVQLFKDEGIDTSYVFTDPDHPSGVALITVDERAENCITVASGANGHLTPADISSVAGAIEEAEYVLMQLEIPIETVEYVADMAYEKGKKVILNPAPAQSLSDGLLGRLYAITPNETEATIISGIAVTDEATAVEAAQLIATRGIPHVIITLGARGALIYSEGRATLIPAPKVEAIDTTAAGDVFNGAFTLALSEGRDLEEAVRFACQAAAISVTRIGAQASAPHRNEITT
ncbi:MAG: ribokinase [Tannerella sp.]|jgi:ribokinase|nr:ribokinase [Tannerella sp.]